MLRFPSLDALQLALTTGAIPPNVADTAASAVFEPGGSILISPSRSLGRSVREALQPFGVEVATDGADAASSGEIVFCWHQLIPLEKAGRPEIPGPTTPVLFDLPVRLVPEFVREILRLGNDRLGLRWLQKTGESGESRGLIRVVGPPYFTLLRAIDRVSDENAPRAFVENAPKVWVELGESYPWSDRLRIPAGTLLLLRSPRRWEFLDDAPFQDVYEVSEFQVPSVPAHRVPAPQPAKIQVPLRLSRGGSSDPAELWVLSDQASGQLDDLVKNADNRLLARLAFAVASPAHDQKDATPLIIIRTRPSKQPPPVLVLDALGYRSYLRLPNLFLPVGQRLHPPLRRDAVSKLLASDPSRLTWLAPRGDGGFDTLSVPDDAFRPLDQWVDYILEREHRALDAWMGSSRFDFESFECREDKQDDPAEPKQPRTRTKNRPEADPLPESLESRRERLRQSRADRDASQPLPELGYTDPGEVLRRLGELERFFFAMEAPPDAEERWPLWAEMARLNHAAGRASDASICWLNALWEPPTPPDGWIAEWSGAETGTATLKLNDAHKVDRLLADGKPSKGDLRSLATALVAVSIDPAASGVAAVLIPRLDRVQRFVETHEASLPTRLVWLAWSSLVRLANNDVLALARARDRLLERLHHQGLSRELDLPSFLRIGDGTGALGERVRIAADHLARFQPLARAWSMKGAIGGPYTGVISDLIFAYGLARTGDLDGSRSLVQAAYQGLNRKDGVVDWLARAFDFRIRQAQEGKTAAGPLEDELMRPLDTMGKAGDDERRKREKVERYKIDRLREHSNILEPHEKIEPYRHWKGAQDDVARELAEVADLTDRAEATRRMEALLNHPSARPANGKRAGDVLTTALEVAYRLGESFARPLFDRVLPVVDGLDQFSKQTGLLDRAIQLAAHFDQPAHVRAYVARFESLLSEVSPRDHEHLEPLLRGCTRGLRKLGLRDEIERILAQMVAAVLRDYKVSSIESLPQIAQREGDGRSQWSRAVRLLLHVAAGWCYFGETDRALPIFDEARLLLFRSDLGPLDQTRLACTYAHAMGQAPTSVALARLEELFTSLERVHDTYTVNSHYSLSRLDLIEAVVLTMTSDEFTLGESGRRWLEDDEFFVRRRIHRDVREALGVAEGSSHA